MRGPALSKENKVEEKNKKQIGRTPKWCGAVLWEGQLEELSGLILFLKHGWEFKG